MVVSAFLVDAHHSTRTKKHRVYPAQSREHGVSNGTASRDNHSRSRFDLAGYYPSNGSRRRTKASESLMHDTPLKAADRESFGFLYVMSNEHIPGLLKIGQSERHPRVRAAELSSHSGVPAEFIVEYWIEVIDRRAAESAVHQAIASKRVSSSREFFRVAVVDAVAAVALHAAPWIAQTSASDRAAGMRRTASTTAECGRCGNLLQYTDLARPAGGFCTCGNPVVYVRDQDVQGTWTGNEPGLVLPKCGICGSRMVLIAATSRLRCTHPRCGHEVAK